MKFKLNNFREKHRCCVIIPAYMEEKHIKDVVQRVREYLSTVVVIDDGSTDQTASEAAEGGAVVLRHESNLGKGAALNTGFMYAGEHNFDYLITLDADGQHNPSDIPVFMEAYLRTGIPVLIGNRMTATGNMPLIRKYTNRFMSWLLSRQMGQYVPDTQCGYRLYSCAEIPFIVPEAKGFAADSEILLQVAARGIRIDSVPIASIYGAEKSKINPISDTIRFATMLCRYRYRSRQTRRL